MSTGKADLDPRHARQILEIAVSIWTLFHIVLLVKLIVERDWLMLVILIPFAILNIWCIARIYKFNKHGK